MTTSLTRFQAYNADSKDQSGIATYTHTTDTHTTDLHPRT